jgi:Mg2+ and Co2+ transporter CorA
MENPLMQNIYYNDEDQLDRKKKMRDKINLLLPDGLMIVLAGIMAFIVLIPLFIHLPTTLDESFKFADYTILGIFILEYLLKTIFARSVVKHILDPWHLLDLFVIVLPLVSLLPVFASDFGLSFPVLRLVRLIRIFAVGGRAIDRKIEMAGSIPEADMTLKPSSEIWVMDGNLENIYKDVQYSQLGNFLSSSTHTWIDISSVSEGDFDRLSNTFGIPRLLIESELADEAYPRLDYFEHYSMIFARIADMKIINKSIGRLFVNREGILVICQGPNIMTMSKSQTRLFHVILERAKKIHTSQEPIVVTMLYTILKYILDKDKQIIAALEQELMNLECIPFHNRPSNFLEITFNLRKEVNQLVPSLLHLKEIISVITTKRVPLEGFNERHEKVFDILMDEASYLHETASSARDNLQSLVDLYINTNSYQMNKVMRLIAIFTCLGIIPAIILGALGTNVSGNPWDIQLWQVFVIPGIMMLALGWVFYRLGWTKG